MCNYITYVRLSLSPRVPPRSDSPSASSSEGTKFGCGHYLITRKVKKIDCMSRTCTHSSRHIVPCRDCNCEKFVGPDREERITKTLPEDYCDHCEKWYRRKSRQ
ncbi:hypothetical protein SCHPADRAFT_889422 [Schizopora paradoxa]|uniref:Uncharacterized protein n=1 Tax=Schizopora paradoxa TaxID=27342 RepID=A0A0H2RXS5_9AGAM|nr:hypothetical protein SCHPADRAFT_889422 [Schizopora paradoxa]